MQKSSPPETHTCKYCKNEKPLGMFRPNRKAKTGHGKICLDCYESRLRRPRKPARPLTPEQRASLRAYGTSPRGKAASRRSYRKLMDDPARREAYRERKRQWRIENKEAFNAYKREWRQKRDSLKNRDEWMRQRYGITLKEYDAMFAQQGNVCAICKLSDEKTMHIDHDHETGKVRGILCSQCNQGIGLLRENQSSIARAIQYLLAARLTDSAPASR